MFITIVAGPRQVGKTTLVRQALEKYAHRFLAIDQPAESRPWVFGDVISQTSEMDGAPRDAAWLIRSWKAARQQCKAFQQTNTGQPFAFVLDEIQKVPASDGYGIYLVFWFTGNLKAALKPRKSYSSA